MIWCAIEQVTPILAIFHAPRVAADPALKQAAAQGTFDPLGHRDC